MLDFFKFNILITPYVIGFVYFFGAVVILFIVVYYFKKIDLKMDIKKTKFYLFLLFLFAEVCWRIFCEFFMVYFKLLDAIK